MRAGAGIALSFAVAAACSTFEAEEHRTRLGAAVGFGAYDVAEDLDHPDDRRQFDQDREWNGFVEGGVELDGDLLLSRIVHAETEHGARAGGDARLEQWLAFGLYCPVLLGGGDLTLRAPLGFGFGAVDFDDPSGPVDSAGAAYVLALGLELEAFSSLTFGAFGYWGEWGEPGDTGGDFANIMVYAGFRF